MQVCIQNTVQMKKRKDDHSDNFVLSIRLKDGDAMRFWAMMDIAKAKSKGYADRTEVARELFGLDEPKLLSPEDIEYFRTGKKVAPKHKTSRTAGIQTKGTDQQQFFIDKRGNKRLYEDETPLPPDED